MEILKRGKTLVLRPKKQSWAALFNSLQKFTDDFMEKGRKQMPVQKRGPVSKDRSQRREHWRKTKEEPRADLTPTHRRVSVSLILAERVGVI